MPRSDAAYLLDMLVAARDARKFATGLTFAEFKQSRLHQNAILKSIEIIGEGCSEISEETKLAYPDIEWKEIAAMRNVVAHKYFEVDLKIIWNVVQNDILYLINHLEFIVPAEDT